MHWRVAAWVTLVGFLLMFGLWSLQWLVPQNAETIDWDVVPNRFRFPLLFTDTLMFLAIGSAALLLITLGLFRKSEGQKLWPFMTLYVTLSIVAMVATHISLSIIADPDGVPISANIVRFSSPSIELVAWICTATLLIPVLIVIALYAFETLFDRAPPMKKN